MNPNVNMGGDSRGRRSEGGQTQDRQWRIETWLEPPPQSPSLRPIFEARSSSHQFGSITAAIGFRDALLHHPDIPTIPPVDRHMLMPESQASNTELTSQALLQHPEPPQSTHHPIPGTNRRWQPEDSLWEKHKEIIKDLYITKRQTLKDTMAYMEKHHSFRASYGTWLRDNSFYVGTNRPIGRRCITNGSSLGVSIRTSPNDKPKKSLANSDKGPASLP